ncbi:MAG: pyrimidine 5'-nucleotidase [Burkholderiaceae bacterium]
MTSAAVRRRRALRRDEQARAAGLAERRRRQVWLFDLDNTLHDVLPHIMPRINRDMTAYVARRLSITQCEADLVRTDYWRRYGATLLGLIRHHAVDPHEFLRDTHVFPDLQALVARSHALVRVFRQLPGRKVIVTNAPRVYARAVLARLGLMPFVDDLVSIEDMAFAGRWQPKPSLAMMRRLAGRLRLDPRRCTMIEDTPRNLWPAKRMGMRTMLVHGWAWRAKAGARPLAGRARRIDFQIQSVLTITRVRLR